LALVAAIADLHDARISLSDNAPGLLVLLSFPSADPLITAADRQPAPSPG